MAKYRKIVGNSAKNIKEITRLVDYNIPDYVRIYDLSYWRHTSGKYYKIQRLFHEWYSKMVDLMD